MCSKVNLKLLGEAGRQAGGSKQPGSMRAANVFLREYMQCQTFEVHIFVDCAISSI